MSRRPCGCGGSRAVSRPRPVSGATPMWAKFDCSGGDSYALKTIASLPDSFWVQVDIYLPSSTLTACEDHDLFGDSADLIELRAGTDNEYEIFLIDDNYPHGDWHWHANGTNTGVAFTADASHTVKFFIDNVGEEVTTYIDGVEVDTDGVFDIDTFMIGGHFADECSCEWYFATNFKVGSSDGGSDIFSDDFSSGDFSAWDSTTGTCTVVAEPEACGGTISADPGSGCYGDTITVTGSGFTPDSPLTVTIGGVTVTFSEADSDGSGDVDGTFVIPDGGFSYPASIVVTDGDGNSGSTSFDLCQPAITTDASACFGDTMTITGSGFFPDSPLTVQIENVSEGVPALIVSITPPDSDGSGNVDGTIVVPPTLPTGTGQTGLVEVTDGEGNSASVEFDLCCPRSADTLGPVTQIGPTLDETGTVEPLDYIHHDGAHWVVAANNDIPDFTAFPPDATWKPLVVYRVPDDGSGVTSYEIDLDPCWQFNNENFAYYGGGTEAHLDFYFQSWSKPVSDVRLGSDGTNLWLAVLTAHTDPYPYISDDDDNAPYLSQAAQFVDLATLTSGFTSFYTGGGTAPPGYDKDVKTANGPLDFFVDSVPVSDGGDNWSGCWTTPRLRVFSLDSSSATDIGDLDSIYYPGSVAAAGSPSSPSLAAGAGSLSGAPVYGNNGGQRYNLLSGLSVCADPSEENVFHVVFAEGGAYGRYGGSGSLGPLNTWAVWDGNAPGVGFRINHSRWSPTAIVDETDLFTNAIDRSNWQFPYDGDGGVPFSGVLPYGYTWPDTADLSWTNAFQVRNDAGSPVLLLAEATTIVGAAPNGNPDPHGNPFLDNAPQYAEPTLRAYDLSSGSAVLVQTLDSGLLPTLDEVTVLYEGTLVTPEAPTQLNDDWGPGYNPVGGLTVSNLYDDPTLSDAPVYLLGVPWVGFDGASPVGSTGWYRIPADLSATFDFMDGLRFVFYSFVTWNPADTDQGNFGRFVTDTRNAWAADQTYGWNWTSGSAGGPEHLDRVCEAIWSRSSTTLDALAETQNFYWDGADSIYGCGSVGGFTYPMIVKFAICRRCAPCGCATSGLHVWQKF